MKPPPFSAFDVASIRLEYAERRLDVRAWADARQCSLETVRRIARGDTYRHAGGQQQHPSWHGPQSGQAAHPALDPSFVPPAALPALSTLVPDFDEADALASLARLQAAMQTPDSEELRTRKAHSLLDELQSQARAQAPQAPNGALVLPQTAAQATREAAPTNPTTDAEEQ